MKKCKICNKGFKRITQSHLDKHNITYEEYQKKFEYEKYRLSKIKEFLETYYIKQGVYNRFVIMYVDGIMIEPEYVEYWRLIDNHIENECRMAIYFRNYGSKIIGLDLDIKDCKILSKIFKALTMDMKINKNAILVTNSGNKGFHIDVFLNKFVEREKIKDIYNIILRLTKLNESVLELRGACNRSYSIPFSSNFKNADKASNYCYVCDHNGIRINDDVAILEKIEAEDITLLDDIINKFKEDNFNLEVGFDEVGSSNITIPLAQEIETIGITQQGTRHKSAFKLGIYYRDIGYCKEEVYLKLQQWHGKLDMKLYKSTEEQSFEDYKYITNSVFLRNQDGMYTYNNGNDIIIMKQDINNVLNIQGSKSLKYLYFSMILQSRRFSNKDGKFEMTYSTIQDMLDIRTQRDYLLKQIHRLEELGCVERYDRGDFNIKTKKYPPNMYKMINDMTYGNCNNNDKIIIQYSRKDVKSILIYCIERLIGEGNINKYFNSKRDWQNFKRP